MNYPTIEDAVGHTPLVRLQRLGAQEHAARGTVVLAKLEGNNPAGSVKDRAALWMIRGAEARGEIKPGDTLIEATSGNTGIALAMAACVKGYRMILIMPEDLSVERAQTMKAYGAELILTPRSGGMEYARDLADKMVAQGKGRVLDQFANADNPLAHYESTGPELWEQTGGRITHFVSAMGTTGTIMGVARFLREKTPKVRIIGAQPAEGSRIPAFASGPRRINPGSTSPARSMNGCPCCRTTPRKPRGAWRARRASSAASRPAAPPGWRSRWRRARRAPPSSSWCATAAIATCRPASFPPDSKQISL